MYSNSDTARYKCALLVLWRHQDVGQAFLPRLRRKFQAPWLANKDKAETAPTYLYLTVSGYKLQVDGD